MAKKMTSAMRLWRDENMEAIREGAKAVKEGRIMPADTFFEWMQARYVRDMWEERIARLQARVEEAEGDTRRWRLARQESNEVIWQIVALVPRDPEKEDIFAAIERTVTDRDRYKALAERRKKALERYGKHENLCRYGLLPPGVRRHSCSLHEDERMEAAAIKECTCGLRAAIEEEGP